MSPSEQSFSKKGKSSLKPDAQELILSDNPAFACETYIFDPSTGEEHLGYLFAAGETEDRGGIGKELLDVVVTAVQSEYYRDASRSPVHSFELALHQANLILHDATERGVRDWMGYFNVAIGVLANQQLHVSVAGEASCWLTRKGMITNVSEGLSHLPITNPLRTFSQVASGDVKTRDTIFLATGNFETVFRPQDAARFTIDHSAQTIVARLGQLYRDQHQEAPLSLIAVSLLPEYVVQPREEMSSPSYKPRTNAPLTADQLRPRKPLKIQRSGWQQGVTIFFGLIKAFGLWLKETFWPLIKKGGALIGVGAAKGGSAIWNMSKQTGQQLMSRNRKAVSQDTAVSYGTMTTPPVPLTQKIGGNVQSIGTFLTRAPIYALSAIVSMPLTSKIFASLALVLVIALGVSLQFLQSKRAADQEIQRAAELLHDAQTKVDAAVSAVRNNNRSQAEELLQEASREADTLAATSLYQEETNKLRGDITTQMDRLQKITRTTSGNVRTVGSFAEQLGSSKPTNLFWIADKLYTFNPSTNAILSMDQSGTIAVASDKTQQIGFFTNGTSHLADKTIFLSNNDPGIALFDTKDNSLNKQEIQLSGTSPTISSLAVFGNRLYTYEPALKNIVSYNKTLRGFSSGTAWVTDTNFPADAIRSFGIDGNIYTLQTDGSLRRLFKGASADFTADQVSPDLKTATKLYTNEDISHLYILDPSTKRVIMFTKKGALVKQIFFDSGASLQDMAVDQKEETLYVLDGTTVVAVSLVENPSPTPTP